MLFETLENRELMSAVSALTLVNADTGQDIMQLTPGITVNLATLPTRNLNVRADATQDTQSVAFNWDGKRRRVENDAPYAFKGDNGQFTPKVGAHTLSAKAFTKNKARGSAEAKLKIDLTVIDDPSAAAPVPTDTSPSAPTSNPAPAPTTNPDPDPTSNPTPAPTPAPEPTPTPAPTPVGVTRLVLVNTDTDQDVATLGSDTTIDIHAIGTDHLSVRAETSGSVESVKFARDGDASYRVENLAPYALAGDDHGNHLNDANLALGNHALTATAFAQDDAGGAEGASATVSFTLIDSGVATTPTPTPNPTPNPTQPTPPPTEGQVPVAGNWQLKFNDEFTTAPNPNTWTNNLWGMTAWSDEAQAYSPSAISVSNGILNMTATKTPLQGKPYTSALLTTGDGANKPSAFSFTYGYAEARIKMPAGKGLWPAFWMLPTATGGYHDDDGEIDIMEFIGDETHTDQLHTHFHGQQWGKAYDAGVDLSQGFHTYGVDWEANGIDYYFDGKKVFSTPNPGITDPHYLILNLAVGGPNTWPGSPDASTAFPATMQVDYVRVFQKAA